MIDVHEYSMGVALEHVVWCKERGMTPAGIVMSVGVTPGPRSANNFLGYDDVVYILARTWEGLAAAEMP